VQTVVWLKQWISRTSVFNNSIKKFPVAFIILIRVEPRVSTTQETSLIKIIKIITTIIIIIIIILVLTRAVIFIILILILKKY
jgi:hypothetical protein